MLGNNGASISSINTPPAQTPESIDAPVNPSTLKSRTTAILSNVKSTWQAKAKFSIHPFRALHTRTLLPLSLRDYIARFSLEFVVLFIAVVAVITNVSIASHADLLETKDQSVIFAFLKSNPALNTALFSQDNTTTILARTDKWVTSALSQSPFSGIVLASTETAQAAESASTTTIQDNVIVKTNPADTANIMRHGETVYEVGSGDSIVSIASSFGISPQTVMMENNLTQTSAIHPGQKLTILPTTGVTHKIKSGETLEQIAADYKVDLIDLLEANDLEVPDDIFAGDTIVVPLPQVNMPVPVKPAATKYANITAGQITLKQATAPASFIGGPVTFVWPTTVRTITQGFSKGHTALDISDSKMEPIFAAADGFVEISGYQTGYGNTIVINHGNGFKTRYGHASELYVSAGDQVVAGQTIAKQGRTGHVVGITGIHLHFEIIKNGVKVNPLLYVKP